MQRLDLGNLRVALIHYWLFERRGGERVLESLCRLFPQADIFTHVYEPAHFPSEIRSRQVRTSFIDRLPWKRTLLPAYLPLMPLALRQFRLTGYDLVISCESGPAKGITVPSGARHICLCLSPMRYIWDLEDLYLAAAHPLQRPFMRVAAAYLRAWDRRTAQYPDAIAAISNHVRRRVRDHWGRSARLIAPPVETARFAIASRAAPPGEYYLYAGHLTAYKRPDIAVRACTRLDRPLLVVGTGPEYDRLRRIAGPSVRFLPEAGDDEFARCVAGCRALLFPGEEDFGIVMVEAMAAGRPVIALARGGALDIVDHEETGILFREQTEDGLVAAIARFEELRPRFLATRMTAAAARFAEPEFHTRIRDLVLEVLQPVHTGDPARVSPGVRRG